MVDLEISDRNAYRPGDDCLKAVDYRKWQEGLLEIGSLSGGLFEPLRLFNFL